MPKTSGLHVAPPDSPLSTAHCDTCAFFDAPSGGCREDSPKIAFDPSTMKPETFFPSTFAGGWCGRHADTYD